jgi:hypothetical protein
VCTGDRPEHDDEHREPERGGCAVFEQLEPDVTGRELLRRDTRTDHDGDQQAGSEKLGDEPSPQCCL